MSLDPGALGIVLLDEIEKASQGVIHGLYQVIDKGEWTNKRLTSGRGTQTETIAFATMQQTNEATCACTLAPAAILGVMAVQANYA